MAILIVKSVSIIEKELSLGRALGTESNKESDRIFLHTV